MSASAGGFVPSTTAEQGDCPELWASLRRLLPAWSADTRLGIGSADVTLEEGRLVAWVTPSPDGPALLRLPLR